MNRDKCFFIVFLPLAAFVIFVGAPFAALVAVQTFYAPDLFDFKLLEDASSFSFFRSAIMERPTQRTSLEHLPLFSMGTAWKSVAKNGKLKLHLFEPRYVEMAKKILRERVKFFGYMHSKQIKVGSEGLLVHVLSFDWRVADAKMTVEIEVEAGRRFTVTDTWTKPATGGGEDLIMASVEAQAHTEFTKAAMERRAKNYRTIVGAQEDAAAQAQAQYEASFGSAKASFGSALEPKSDEVGSDRAEAGGTPDPTRNSESKPGESREAKAGPDPRKRRPPSYNKRHFRGQMMQHRKYGYQGVIIGSDSKCKADETWIQKMGVDKLSGGRNQPFYHVFVESSVNEGRETYVAHENIEIITGAAILQDDPRVVFEFERFDSSRGRYVGYGKNHQANRKRADDEL